MIRCTGTTFGINVRQPISELAETLSSESALHVGTVETECAGVNATLAVTSDFCRFDERLVLKKTGVKHLPLVIVFLGKVFADLDTVAEEFVDEGVSSEEGKP